MSLQPCKSENTRSSVVIRDNLKSKSRYLSALMCVCILLGSVKSSWAIDEMSIRPTVETVSQSVVYIRYQEQAQEWRDGQLVKIWHELPNAKEYLPKFNSIEGTGFITEHNGFHYLVTAKHVAQNIKPTTEIIMNDRFGKTIEVTFEFLESLIPSMKWSYHPSADIAIHPFGIKDEMNIAVLGASTFLTSEISVPLLTDSYIFGFPLGQGITSMISPIAQQAHIASWITTVNRPTIPKELKFILLDQALAQGYSGAPVFVNAPTTNILIGTPYPLVFIGIVSSVVPDQTGGKLSLVVPVQYLRELFESKAIQLYESAPFDNPN